jgi:hypothetical protein
LAKFGGKSRAPHKDGEVVDGFSTIIFKIWPKDIIHHCIYPSSFIISFLNILLLI